MPYKDPLKELERVRKRMLTNGFAKVREATAWADAQIQSLKQMGVIHTAQDWRELRKELRKSKLSDTTRNDLSNLPSSEI